MLSRLPPESFSWSRWRRFSLFRRLVIAFRTEDIIAKKAILTPFIVGYCRAEHLLCRPKLNNMAVMFFDGEFSWCHLRNEEWESLCDT